MHRETVRVRLLPYVRTGALLAAVVVSAACGLLDAAGVFGPPLQCEGEFGPCFCPADDDETLCVGDGCLCDRDGNVFCDDPEAACEVIEEDSCENPTCSCFDVQENEVAGCDCGSEAAVCRSESAQNYIQMVDPQVGCAGRCFCDDLEEAPPTCLCGGESGYLPCLQEVAGQACTAPGDCDVLASAVSTFTCVDDADCENLGYPLELGLTCKLQRCLISVKSEDAPCPSGLTPGIGDVCIIEQRPTIPCRSDNVCGSLLEAL